LTVTTREPVTLELGTQIKSVTLQSGRFLFQAYVLFGGGKGWIVLTTEEDLPAFTDKGREYRKRRIHATLHPGRPLIGEEHAVTPIAVRVSDAQKDWVKHRADQKKMAVSEYIRSLLVEEGMPS
jgi:hypothetical protein